MSTGSEFQTEGAATLKPREANVVWTRGTDNRLVLEEHRERAGCGSLGESAGRLVACTACSLYKIRERVLTTPTINIVT